MATKRLTDAIIQRLSRPASGRLEISDIEKGLFLHLKETKKRSWVVVYRVAEPSGKRGRRTKMHIGDWPTVSIEDARAHARRLGAMAAGGRDPKQELATERQRKELGSVEAISAAWLKAMRAGQATGRLKRAPAQGTIKNREATLRLHLNPRIGGMPLEEVTPAMLGQVLQSIDDAGGPVDEVLKVFNGLWSFAETRGQVSGLRPSAKFRPRQVQQAIPRALSDEELRSIWQAADAMGYPFGCAVQLLMLTGQRRSEIAEARWEWFNKELGTLTIPMSATKNRAGAHEVVLSKQSLELLEYAAAVHRKLTPNSPFIFTSAAGNTPISGWSKSLDILSRNRRGAMAGLIQAEIAALEAKGVKSQARRVAKQSARAKIDGIKLEPWRIHDLRHTFITRARDGERNERGEVEWSSTLDVVQATVNHSLSEGVTAVYDHGDIALRYRLRRRELAEWWAKKLQEITA